MLIITLLGWDIPILLVNKLSLRKVVDLSSSILTYYRSSENSMGWLGIRPVCKAQALPVSWTVS